MSAVVTHAQPLYLPQRTVIVVVYILLKLKTLVKFFYYDKQYFFILKGLHLLIL